MQHNLLYTDPKAEYATAWRTDVEGAQSAAQLPSCGKMLLLLCLTAFFLQAIAGLMRVYVNPDGITYLRVTNLLSEGKLEEGFSNFGVNTFIYMLVLFKRLGLDPFYTGIWWNAIMSSLVVLPLFGWIRRMFDRRIAIIASLLYAFHPIVLSIGSAIMRGPMFWLFFNLTIYCAWRAMTEVRFRWFIVAGCTLTLAIHTRSEAWFLIIPITLWALGRFWFATGYRVRLCFGTLLLLAIVPGLIAVMNLTVLKTCPQWGIFRPSHAHQLAKLYEKAKNEIKDLCETKEDKVEAPAKRKPAKSPAKKTPTKKTPIKKIEKTEAPPSFATDGLRRALLRLVKSYSFLYGIYALVGVCVWRGRRRFALHAMLLMIVPLFAVVWYRSCNNDVSPRYFLPIVFVSLPFISIGLLWITRKIISIRGGQHDHEDEENDVTKKTLSRKPLYGLIGMMVFTLIVSCFGTVWGTNRSEQKECELGKWILKTFGPEQEICCINRLSRMAAWYANTDSQSRLDYPVWGPNRKITPNYKLVRVFQKNKPQIVLCWESHRRPKEMPGLFETLKENNYYGYEPVQTGVLEEFEPKVIVLIRKGPK